MKYFDKEDAITEYEKQLQKKDKEIERLTNELEREKSQVKEYGTKLIKVREYINSIGWNTTIPNIQDNVWEILDKEKQ